MYLNVGNKLNDKVYNIVLSQDVNGTPAEANSMTFRTILVFIGEGVTFEIVLYPGFYLASMIEI